MILINNKDFSKLRYFDVETFLNNADLDENFFVEFKNDEVTTRGLAKEICAFSNTFGGYIFLGIEDDKTITGCVKWTEEKINNVFRDLIHPNPPFDIKRLSKNGKKIYVIRIDEGGNPPYITHHDMSEEQKELLKNHFSTGKRGRSDYCYAFIEASVKSLAHNGRICCIGSLDDNWKIIQKE